MTEQNTAVRAMTAAASFVDRWSWWRLAQNDQSQIGKALPIHPGEYELGYYRTRAKGGQWEPVGIYPDEEFVDRGFRSGKPVADLPLLFQWSCRNPISYEAYVRALEGDGFEDEPPAPIGDNSGDADPFEAIRIEFEGEAEQAREFLKAEVKTQADADKAGIWSKRLADISKRADGEREREKAPHLSASRAVDDKWRPLVGDAKDMATSLKRHVEPFLVAQKRAEEARARAAADEAARLRRAAEELTRQAHASDQQSSEDRAKLIQQAQEADKAAEVQNATAGRSGARVALRTEKIGIVTDYAKAAAALVAMKHPDMLAEIDRLAKAAAKKNFPFDGMEIREEERVV